MLRNQKISPVKSHSHHQVRSLSLLIRRTYTISDTYYYYTKFRIPRLLCTVGVLLILGTVPS